jgi:hypothetical protein
MMPLDAITDAAAAAFNVWQKAAWTRSYLERGRRFVGLSDEALGAEWVQAFRALVFSIETSPNKLQATKDFTAELNLRGLPMPVESVSDAVAAAVSEIRERGPDDPGVLAVIRAWRLARARPSH